MRRRRKPSHHSTDLLILITLTIFVTALFGLLWGYVLANAQTILFITGIALIVFIALGWLNPNKVRKRIIARFS